MEHKKTKTHSVFPVRFAPLLMSSDSHAGWLEVCPVAELPPGKRRLVQLKSVEIALFNVNGTIYAIKNRCPHRSGPLIRGFIDDTGGIKCPMHGWRFDLRDGSSPRPAHATVYQVKAENGLLYLQL